MIMDKNKNVGSEFNSEGSLVLSEEAQSGSAQNENRIFVCFNYMFFVQDKSYIVVCVVIFNDDNILFGGENNEEGVDMILSLFMLFKVTNNKDNRD
jgi:hypothetical protein